MQTQTVEFAVTCKHGNITGIGKSSILQPKTNFKGGSDSIKWYKDKTKEKNK